MTRNAAWRDIHDPLVRDLVASASGDEATAQFESFESFEPFEPLEPAQSASVDAIAQSVERWAYDERLPDAIESSPINVIVLERGKEERGTAEAAQPLEADIDPLVIDPVSAMLADHVRVRGINRMRRHHRS